MVMNGKLMKCIPCVYVPVSDVVRSALWWEQTIGLEYAVPFTPGKDDHAAFKLADGQWMFLIKAAGNQTTNFTALIDGIPYENAAFCFEVREIEHIYRHLKERNVRLGELEDRGGCGINFKFFDPDGNKFDVNENVNMHRTPEQIERLKRELFASV
jgi:hypothetical protein